MITAQVATVPEREDMLREMVASLAPQVDQLNVFCNSYKHLPGWLGAFSNVDGRLMDNSTGDAAKFYGIEELEGYILTCDDDIRYPRDYVKALINNIEKYHRQAIVSFHGRIMLPKPIESYYFDRVEGYHCLKNLDRDVRVNVAGTGVMGWHSSTIKLNYSDFKIPNMADIWMAKFATQQNVPLVVAKHPSFWIIPLDEEDKRPTIYKDFFDDHHLQTELYNSF